ncbi:hypothetical protein I5M27_14460 [Adhaeribacter sp. BT258]|uniref:Outer membrane protein beta-barrel domain-containing protein n=1 Tax=Adhaeribacter terrigena TaxID=2793070 RepID=A0ABS1C6J2_9BACT|nr:hypothetical protein [Adhaeribacter terrigena]MBK0404195.1 hypothetical protein [Adhaeribacter terrigena]
MEKKLLLFCLFLIAFSGKVLAHEVEVDSVVNSQFYRNSVYAELLGNGVFGSLNYERLFWIPASETTVAARVGGLLLEAGQVGGTFEYQMIAVGEVTFFSGKRAVKFESGFGVTVYTDSQGYNEAYGHSGNYWEFIPVLRIGARWQPRAKPYLVRLGFTPLFFGDDSPVYKFPVVPFGGLSFGYSFGKRHK